MKKLFSTKYKAIFYPLLFLSLFLSLSYSQVHAEVEKIEVTGSRIKRIDVEGPSPITIITSKELEQSPYNSVGEFLYETNLSPFGGLSVHAASTLILINGKRVVESHNESVNINTVPLEAIERIEIIKDGSSAIYGSDALGGVINFITKSQLNGTEVSFKFIPVLFPFKDKDGPAKGAGEDIYKLYKGGSQIKGSILWGTSNAQGHTTALLRLEASDSALPKDRPSSWYTPYYSPTSIYPVFRTQGENFLHPDCPKDSIFPKKSENPNTCRYSYLYLQPKAGISIGVSGFLESVYKHNGIEYYFQSLPSYERSTSKRLPTPGEIELNAGHKMSFGTGKKGVLIYRFEDLGTRNFTDSGFIIDNAFGAKGYFSAIWDWDLSFKTSATFSNEKSENSLLKDTITNLIYTGQVDPFKNTKEARGDLDTASYAFDIKGRSFLLSSDFITTGKIKTVDVAMGFQALHNIYQYLPDLEVQKENIVGGAKRAPKNDNRSIVSTFFEGAYFLGDRFEAQAAGRLDYYSDFGLTANPKLAFRYQASKNFAMRGSIGTSFIAPSLALLNTPATNSVPFLIDYAACFNDLDKNGVLKNFPDKEVVKDYFIDQRETLERSDISEDTKSELKENVHPQFQTTFSCQPHQYAVRFTGNKDLKETRGLTASVSSIMQFNQNSSLTVDVWYLKVDGSPTHGISNQTTLAELKLGRDHVKKQGIAINRNDSGELLRKSRKSKDDPDKEESGIETTMLNIGETRLAGVDFLFSSAFPQHKYKGGVFSFQSEGNIALYSKLQRFPGLGFTDSIGKSTLPRWRNIAALNWSNQNYQLSVKWHLFASVLKARTQAETLPISQRFDISCVWNKDHKTTFVFGMQNLLNSSVLDDSIKINGIRATSPAHDSRGPHFYIAYKKAL